MRPIEIINKLCPKARGEYQEAFRAGDGLMLAAGINTPLRLAHFLAQVLHECGGLTITFENMNYKAPRIMEIFGVGHHSAKVTAEESVELAGNPQALAERVYGIGNPKKAHEFENTRPGDGYRYRGGGILQTTGRNNYRRVGTKCHVDFEGFPDLVCTAAHALKPALAEWVESKCNELADANDIEGITRKINGGLNGFAERKAWFLKARPLCDGVTFAATPAVVAAQPRPAPPVEPKVVPAPSPITPRGAASSTSIVGGIVAALNMNSVTGILICLAVGGAVALAVHFWPKKG